MSDLVESLMFVREKPWHGLGIMVEESPTSADAIKLAGLDWTVEGKPVFTESGIQIPGYVANTRSSDDSILGIVSERYKVVQNIDAFEFTDSLVESDDVRYETAGSLKNGKVIWLLAKMPNTKVLDDEFEPYVCFANSHDGSAAIKVCCTPIRVVCANTLNLALTTAKRSWSTKHMGDIQSKLSEARYTLGLANEYMTNLKAEAENLAAQKITNEEINKYFDILFPITPETSKRRIRNIQEFKENYFRCYNMADIANYKGTKWGAINAMTDLVDHVAPSRMTDTYQENNWYNIMNGHNVVDKFYATLIAA